MHQAAPNVLAPSPRRSRGVEPPFDQQTMVCLLFTFPRLPHQDNPGRRPSPALHYLQSMPSTDDTLSLPAAPLPTRGPKHAGPGTDKGITKGRNKGTTITVLDNESTTTSSGSKCV